jgi:type IV pilus assembly protein PilV
MAMRATDRRYERGTTLLEAMISLVILLIGLVAMARLQIFGMSSTQGGRAQTIATQLATELAGALATVDSTKAPGTTLLTASFAGAAPPSGFGALLADPSSAHAFSDASPVPGVRLDATLEQDPLAPGTPLYRRRWTVWDMTVTNPAGATVTTGKMIAVSVIWHERAIGIPREIVVYAANGNLSNVMAFIDPTR